MIFFSRLGTIKLFNSLFGLIITKVIIYWRETKRITSTKIKRSLKFTIAKKNKKLQSKDGFSTGFNENSTWTFEKRSCK